MAVTITGTVRNGGAYEVNSKNGKQTMISFNVVDEIGNAFACQMWQDDPQHQQLAQVIGNARRHPIQCVVAGYTVRMRKFQDGTERPQANFVVTDVKIPNVIG